MGLMSMSSSRGLGASQHDYGPVKVTLPEQFSLPSPTPPVVFRAKVNSSQHNSLESHCTVRLRAQASCLTLLYLLN